MEPETSTPGTRVGMGMPTYGDIATRTPADTSEA